jgi:hypothetical protein
MRSMLSIIAASRRRVLNPLSLEPALWLDAADASTLYDATSGGSLVAADGSVARWEDKSGNARHATQSDAGKRPSRKTDGLRFDGTDDEMSLISGFGMTRNVSGFTMIAVRRFASLPTAFQFIFSASDATSAQNARCTIYGGQTSGKSGVGGRNADSGTFSSVNSSANISTSVAELQSGVLNYASRVAELHINGALYGSTSSFLNGDNTADTDSSRIAIGARASGGGFYFNGWIAELFTFSYALSTTDRQLVERYLAAKWGITLA